MFYDNFLRLCNQKNVTPTRAVTEMGFQKSVATRWKKSIPTDVNKIKVAEYFGISVNELMSNSVSLTPAADTNYSLSNKENRDIAKKVDAFMADLESDGLIFDGEPATPEALDDLRRAITIGYEMARRKNKEKYTPKKYSKK